MLETHMHADDVDLGPALARLYGSADPPVRLTKLKGGASSRSYYRLEWIGAQGPATGPRSLVVMRLPSDALGSDEVDRGLRPTELPFIDVQRMLATRGVPVSRVYVDDTSHRVLLLEDLGDETFEARLEKTPTSRWEEPYGAAIDLLADMHRACAGGAPSESIAFRRSFDRALLRSEFDHFREWGLEALGGELPPAERATLDRIFDSITAELIALPQGFVHRDYQSRNLMWAGARRLTVIDFQDALLGPAPYDLVALLCDSYVALPQSLQEAMLARYATKLGLDAQATAQLIAGFWLMAIQRKLKDAGRFVFIDRQRGNPDFLRFYPQSMRYVGRALRVAGQTELFQLLERYLDGFPDSSPVPRAIDPGHG
jgi:aminoglycoside/choline kinase family phosphotransferase